MPFLVGPTQPAISEKSFFILRARKQKELIILLSDMVRQPIMTLILLIQDLAKIVNPPHEQVYTPAQQQEQAILSAKNAIDTMTQSLLNKHNFPISPNWNIHELTAHVIENDNLNNLSFLIDTVQDLATYGATSEFFVSAIRLLEQGGAWG